MKKRYLKKWVEVVLMIMIFISILVLGSESEKFFITSKLIALAIMLINTKILFKYSRLGGE